MARQVRRVRRAQERRSFLADTDPRTISFDTVKNSIDRKIQIIGSYRPDRYVHAPIPLNNSYYSQSNNNYKTPYTPARFSVERNNYNKIGIRDTENYNNAPLTQGYNSNYDNSSSYQGYNRNNAQLPQGYNSNYDNSSSYQGYNRNNAPLPQGYNSNYDNSSSYQGYNRNNAPLPQGYNSNYDGSSSYQGYNRNNAPLPQGYNSNYDGSSSYQGYNRNNAPLPQGYNSNYDGSSSYQQYYNHNYKNNPLAYKVEMQNDNSSPEDRDDDYAGKVVINVSLRK